ncbi:MAG: hypothetical protein J2P52_02440 [Blastocatellia bacterium]|nr:hypothetical protein [Blastocatellia bacterium]
MRYGRLMTMAIVFAGSPFAPAAFAQQKTNQVQQWEYKTVSSCDPRDRGTDIQQLGEEGWELVAIDANGCLLSYFKRPKGAGPQQVTKQPAQAAPQCSIPLDKAPTIRGLHLGMSADELLSLFAPNNQSKFQVETALKRAGAAPNYGLATFGLSPGASAMAEVKEKFAGISDFGFKTFDGRVVEIRVNYEMNRPDLYPSWTIDEWTAKVSNSFGLPGANYWESPPTLYNNQRTLRCKELEVETSMFFGPTLPVIGAYHTPSLTITDPSYRQVLNQRAKSDQGQKQREFVF